MPGGDCVALDATMDALRKRGIECVETGWDRNAMGAGNFDLAHIQHCNFSWSWGNYEAVRDVGLLYVLTPVFYPGPLLSGITAENLQEIISGARAILPFSQKERGAIWTMNWGMGGRHDLPFKVLPNATSREFHAPDGHEHQPTLDVVCVSARGDSDKNIPMLRRILGRVCGDNFTVATGLSRSDLADAYKHHRVFVNASESERMSLTIGEALCAGCRVLATDQNWGNSHYPGLVTFDPTDELHLEHLVRWALTSRDWDYRPNAAARCLTWEWVAEKLEGVYREVLGAV